MLQALPHPGFSWSLTQHAAGFNERVIREMLTCAMPFTGREHRSGYQYDITKLMMKANILTENLRDGRNDAWRDYQQILSELGLMVSLKVTDRLILTPIAQKLVASMISYRELMNCQVLRYQYPNGQKSDISPRLRETLGLAISTNLIEVQAGAGVLIKPGTLVLRVLLRLLDAGELPLISADEIRCFLMPCRRNDESEVAYTKLISARAQGSDLRTHYPHSRRNIQDWLKLLNETSIFKGDGKTYVRLTDNAIEHRADLLQACETEEHPSSFWLPISGNNDHRRTWFEHFGSSDLFSGGDIELTNSASEMMRWEEAEDHIGSDPTQPINLTRFDKSRMMSKASPDLSSDLDELARKVLAGSMKRHAKALLHDELVTRYAERYQRQGADVYIDNKSVDLFVNWGGDRQAIFEMKTVSSASLSARLRLAVGQVKEYGYRLNREQGIMPDQVIVIDQKLRKSGYLKDFLTDYMDIGLICFNGREETTNASRGSKSSDLWH